LSPRRDLEDGLDRYNNFAELARTERSGVDYHLEGRRRASPLLVLAPHGGRIEPGTAEIARAIAGREFSYAAFLGIAPGNNRHLHITSHRFDEPRILRLCLAHDVVVCVHGCRGAGERAHLGGRDHHLRDRLAEALRAEGFTVSTQGHPWPGEEEDNLCNRGRLRAGVQLELTRGLRESARLPELVLALRRVLLELAGHKEDPMAGWTGPRRPLHWLALLGLLGVSGCQGLPEGAAAVRPFDAARYLGTWHEIARLDHRFERGLSQVTAEYIDEGRRIRVVNRGWDAASGHWKQAVGRALPAGDPDEGRFKVSFFGPFFGAYNILALDPDYSLALVSGSDTRWLWILAREPQVARDRLEPLLEKARALGFPWDELIWVEQGPLP